MLSFVLRFFTGICNFEVERKPPKKSKHEGKLKFGEEISRHYDVGDFLGEGMYASVRLAVHKQTGQKRAIKRIALQSAPNLESSVLKINKDVQNSEIQLLLDLKHPNIIEVFEVYKY